MASATRRSARRLRELSRRQAIIERAARALAAGRFDDEPTRRKLAEHVTRMESWRAVRRASVIDGLEQCLELITLENEHG